MVSCKEYSIRPATYQGMVSEGHMINHEQAEGVGRSWLWLEVLPALPDVHMVGMESYHVFDAIFAASYYLLGLLMTTLILSH